MPQHYSNMSNEKLEEYIVYLVHKYPNNQELGAKVKELVYVIMDKEKKTISNDES